MRASIAILVALTIPAAAQTPLLVCGDLNGYAFYAEGGIVAKGKGGWQQDSISPGRMVLMDLGGGKYDILSQDAGASAYSYTKENCTVLPHTATDKRPELMFVAICNRAVETFLFSIDLKAGNGKLLWTQNKSVDALSKATAMTSNCRVPN